MRAMLMGVVMLMASLAHAQPEVGPEPGIELRSIEVDGTTYPFAVYRSPALEPGEPAPMIVFLHGSGECGTDGTKQLAVGLMPEVLYNNARWPAVILSPQKPDQQSQWDAHADAVLAMIDETVDRHDVDTDRIALTGLSQGGNGSFVIGARHAEVFCAVAPVCGYVGFEATPRPGETRRRSWIDDASDPRVVEIAQGLANTPVWAFHGDADNVVPLSQSEVAIDAIRQRNEDVKLTVLEGVGHAAWINAYRDAALAAWLLKDRSAE